MHLPIDASAAGHHIDSLYFLAFKLIAGTFVLVVAVLLYMIIRYRGGANKKAAYLQGNTKGALTLTLVLAMAVFIGIDINLAYHDHAAFKEVYSSPPTAGEAFRVQVMGEQYAWEFRYPGKDGVYGTADDAITRTLMVPVNRPVMLEMRSKDVIHSFFLPNFRIKQDVLPGLTTKIYFTATMTSDEYRAASIEAFGENNASEMEIACAELCGLGHTKMRGPLKVDTQEAVDAYIAGNTDEWADHTPWDIFEKKGGAK